MRTHSLADLPGVPKRFDRLFWHTVRMARLGPDIHFARSYETVEPYRVARCVILHLEPFRTGLVIGWYSRTGQEEHEALLRAVRMREPSRKELDDFDDNVTQRPSRAGGLRFGATRGGPVLSRRPDARMAAVRHAGPYPEPGDDWQEFRGRW